VRFDLPSSDSVVAVLHKLIANESEGLLGYFLLIGKEFFIVFSIVTFLGIRASLVQGLMDIVESRGQKPSMIDPQFSSVFF